MVIELHVCSSWNITKQKKIRKIMQCQTIKSSLLLYGGGVSFPYKRNILYLLLLKCKKTFFEWNFILKN